MNRKYGNCVEKIALRSKGPEETPQFGQVVFKKSTLPLLILNGKDEVRFVIDQRSFWCKKYQDRNTRHGNGGQN